jgi:hypothetical protein
MFYKLILPVIISFLFLFELKAQDKVEETADEPEENSASIKRYKYEIGTDIKWIFLQTIINNYSNSSYSYSYTNNGMRLFGRINKSKRIPEKYRTRRYAYRFGLRLNGAFTFFNTLDTTSVIYNYNNGYSYSKNPNYFSILAETGYEIQKQMRRFQLFYGADAGLSYVSSSNDIFVYDRNNSNTSTAFIKRGELNNNSFSVALSPLVGMKYFIHSRISVSAEARFSLGLCYNYAKDGYVGTIIKTGGLNLWTDPLYALNMNYYFNK